MDTLRNNPVKYMGLDIGLKRVGVSLSDSLKIIAFPFKVFQFIDNKTLLNDIERIIEEEHIEKVIIGNPLNIQGKRSSLTSDLFKIIDFLKKNLKVETILSDERYTTKKANSDLHSLKLNWKKRKKVVDKVAASLILQNFLDKNK